MSEIPYDANCAPCRDAAGKDRAGLTNDQLCVPHLRLNRDRWKERAEKAETEQWGNVWTLVEKLGISSSGCPDSQILIHVEQLRKRIIILEARLDGISRALPEWGERPILTRLQWMRERHEELVAVLRDAATCNSCPVCGGNQYPAQARSGHAPDCRLAKCLEVRS